MKNIPNWIKILLVLILIIASKFLFFSKADEKGAAANGAKKNNPLAVNFYVARFNPYENRVFATGKIGTMNEISILPELSGKVTGIYFKEGETVSKGSLLVKLNDADLQAQLLKIKTQLKLAEQKLQRLKKLREINGVSEEEFDMQENEIAVLKADEAFTQAQIAKTAISAPFAGMIGLKNISEGSFVSPNTPIVSLVQLQPLYVEFSISDKYAALIKNGMKIEFVSENELSSANYTASVYAVEPKVDETTKTIKIRALYSGAQKLYPGSYVNVYVNLGDKKNVLMVPTQCIIPTLKGQKVFVAKNGIAVETQVKIGQRNDQNVSVLEGLAEGDTVITTGLMSVKKDAKLVLIKVKD